MTAVNQGGNNVVGDNGAHVHIAVGADAEQSFFFAFYSIATLSQGPNPAQIGLLEPKPATVMKYVAR